jgi:hypothetical protein
VASFTNIKLFVLAGIGHRDLEVNKTRSRESPPSSLGLMPMASTDSDVKPFEVGFTLQVSYLSQLVTLVWNRGVYVTSCMAVTP